MCASKKFDSEKDFKGKVGDEEEVAGKCFTWWIFNGPEMLYFHVKNWKLEGFGAAYQGPNGLKHKNL